MVIEAAVTEVAETAEVVLDAAVSPVASLVVAGSVASEVEEAAEATVVVDVVEVGEATATNAPQADRLAVGNQPRRR